MDNFKSYEFKFLYLINKCILLFKYIENSYQKEILCDIKKFINKLYDVLSSLNIDKNIDKKNKILEILIEYFEKNIETRIYKLINSPDKENIILEIEKKALLITEKKKNREENSENQNINKKIDNDVNSKDLINFENKINEKIKSIFSEIENNIKRSLSEYFSHTQHIEYDLDKRFNEKIENNNIYIENKIKEYIKNNLINNTHNIDNMSNIDNGKFNEYINNLIKEHINKLYLYMENIIKFYCSKNNESNDYIDNKIETLNIDLKKKIINDIENKIIQLGNIFNNNIREIFNNLNNRIIENENDIINTINEKLINNQFNKNNFNISFDKEINEVQLYYYNELIASTKINIKGLIGPKGPQGNKGDNGITPIIKKVQVTDNNKIKFIVQENNNIYEIISDNSIPSGPQGPQGIQGERGIAGKVQMDINWNQENVMRIDEENKNSLIFLKSLCVGDKSHCLKDNSIAISGAKCYQDNSFAIGINSKTLDSESIALYGTCIGKKSYSYRADNVDENMVKFGKKEKNVYNISGYDIISKEINIECDVLKIKTNKYENNKIKELEEKIYTLEKKIISLEKNKF
jgi:hypothetical protein